MNNHQAVVLTQHAETRMNQRATSRSHLRLALEFGERIEQDGATVYFLGRRHLPVWLNPSEAERAEGTTAVVARDGAVITIFRRHRLARSLRRRGRYRAAH